MSVRTVKRDIEFMVDRHGLPVEYDQKRWGYFYSKPVDGFPKAPMTSIAVFCTLVPCQMDGALRAGGRIQMRPFAALG